MLKVDKILFVTLSNIGDVILTLPVLDYLKSLFPQGKITVITASRPQGIFKTNPDIEKVIVYNKRCRFNEKIALFNELKKERFDLVVDLRNSFLGRFLPVKYRAYQSWFTPPGLRHMRDKHMYKIKKLQTINSKGYLQGQSLYISSKDQQYIDGIFRENKINKPDKVIVISAGARSHIKRWPKEKFLELIADIVKEFNAKIFLIGDQDDAAINSFLVNSSAYPVIDLTAKTTIPQVAELLKRSSLLVTNDSANMHLASYLNRPAVAIFGPTDDQKYGPWSEKFRLVKKEVFCRPCCEAQCRFNNLMCMNLINKDDVLKAVRELLEGKDFKKQGYRQDCKRILISRTDRIGDVILSTPVIKALRDAYPYAFIAMMVRPYTKALITGNPYLDEVIVFDKDKIKGVIKTLKFAWELRKKNFDLAMIVHASTRIHLLMFLAGIRKRLGWDWKSKLFLTHKVKHLKHLGQKHESEYSLDLVRFLGIEPAEKEFFLPVIKENDLKIERLLREKGVSQTDRILVIHPGASCYSKVWLPDNYAKVADKLASELGFKVVITSGLEKTDQEIARSVIQAMRIPAIDFVANISLLETVNLLKRSSLFISVDTGPMHMASVLGVPQVVLFSRNQPGIGPVRWGPVNKKSKVIHKDVGCKDCLAHNCKNAFLCLQAITVEDVIAAAREVLSK